MKRDSRSIMKGFFPCLVLSLVLVFSLLGTAVGAVAAYALSSPALLLDQIKEQSVAQTVHGALQSDFDTQYNTTAVPGDVYMDVLTVQWVENAMETWVTNAYEEPAEAPTLDFSSLDASISGYFADFASQNDYEIDDAYNEKLTEVTSNAHSTITENIDVYHIQTMQDAGIWNRILSHGRLVVALAIACSALSLGLLLALFFLRRRGLYWIGSGLLVSGLLLGGSAGGVLASGVIRRFVLKEAAVYAVFTGIMTTLARIFLIIGILTFLIGLMLCCTSTIFARRNLPPESPETSPAEAEAASEV